MLKKATWFVCFLVLAMSCLDEPDCFRLNNNIIGIAFKKMIGGAADTVAVIGVGASGTDSVFNQFILTNGIYLPLNLFTDQTSFSIQGLDELHQLSVGYDARTQFVSEECGARYVLSNLSLLNHDFDSVRIVNTSPFPSEAGANIEVYRCPVTNVVKVSFRQLTMDNSVSNAAVNARKIVGVVDDYSDIQRYVDTTLQTINLPLNPEANLNTFDLTLADQTDPINLAMTYTRRPRKFFDICGDQQLFAKLGVTATNVDSMLVAKDSIQDPPVTNVIIYKCPQTNLMRLYFKQPGGGVRADTIHLKRVTEGTNVYYENPDPALGYTLVTLPLDRNANGAGSAVFTFESHDQPNKTLKVTYNAVRTELYNACGTQAVFSELAVDPTSTFVNPTLKVATVQYPIVTNFEIIQ